MGRLIRNAFMGKRWAQPKDPKLVEEATSKDDVPYSASTFQVVEPLLKASVAYVPAVVVVCGFLVTEAQRSFFGLEGIGFDLNAALAAGLGFFIDLPSDLVEVVVASDRSVKLEIAASLFAAAVIAQTARTVRETGGEARASAGSEARREKKLLALLILLATVTSVALTSAKLWTLDLPATFIADIFKYQPAHVVDVNLYGPSYTRAAKKSGEVAHRFAQSAQDIWRLLACAHVKDGVAKDGASSGISCDGLVDPRTELEARYLGGLAAAIAAIAMGLAVLTYGRSVTRPRPVFHVIVWPILIYTVVSVPYTYGRLKRIPQFPDAYVYIKSARSVLPDDLLRLIGDESVEKRSRPTSPKAYPRLHAFLITRNDKQLGLLIPVSAPCPAARNQSAFGERKWTWRRLNFASSEVAFVQTLDDADDKSKLFRAFITRRQTCPSSKDEPPIV